MKNVNLRKAFILITLFAYPICLIFSTSTLLCTNIFLSMIVLASLNKWTWKNVLIILSPLFIFPAFVYTLFNWASLLPFDFTISQLLWLTIYSFFYWYLFKNLWHWIKPELRSFFVIVMIIFIFTVFFLGKLPLECIYVSKDEKGVAENAIEICKFFNLYNPTDVEVSKFSGLIVLDKIFAIAGAIHIGMLILIGIIYSNLVNSKHDN